MVIHLRRIPVRIPYHLPIGGHDRDAGVHRSPESLAVGIYRQTTAQSPVMLHAVGHKHAAGLEIVGQVPQVEASSRT